MVFKRKILRKIFKLVKNEDTTGEWRARKNNELKRVFRKDNVLNIIRSQRLQWAGHVCRSQNQLIHIVMDENPVGKRPLGRPCLRWVDLIK